MPALVSDADQLERSQRQRDIWARRPRRVPGAIDKSADWLTQGEAAAVIGVSYHTANFKRAWRALVEAATSGEPTTLNDVAVRMAPCRILGVDRWCAQRDDILRLAECMQRKERRWPTRPEGWLTLEETAARSGDQVDPDVLADAWRALTKGTAYHGFARIAGLDIRMMRGHVHANERWFIHPDDADRLVEAIRGRLPHLRKGFLPPAAIAARVQPDARPLVPKLMAMLERAKSKRGTPDSQETATGIRRFLVDGRSTPCLPESEYARFVDILTDMYDSATAEEVSQFTP